MLCFPKPFSGFTAVAAFLQCMTTLAALDPNCHPGGNFNLSTWRLDPLNELQTRPPPRPIASVDLQGCNGFADEYYFLSASDDGAMSMIVPKPTLFKSCDITRVYDCGVQLREEAPSGWNSLNPVNRLFADMAVTRFGGMEGMHIMRMVFVGSSRKNPLLNMYYEANGSVRMGVRKCETCRLMYTQLGVAPPAQRFTFEARFEGGTITASLNGGTFKTLVNFPAFHNLPNISFEIGNYINPFGKSGGMSASELRLYDLRVAH